MGGTLVCSCCWRSRARRSRAIASSIAARSAFSLASLLSIWIWSTEINWQKTREKKYLSCAQTTQEL